VTLLAAGAAVNLSRKHAVTALMLSAIEGHAEVVAALIAAGARVADTNEEGLTALHLAIEDAQTAAALLEAPDVSTFIDATDEDGCTGLMLTSSNGNTESAKQLVAAGADVNKANARGWTALMFACQNGIAECVAVLLAAAASPDAASTEGVTSLMIASGGGYSRAVQELLANGAAVDMVDAAGMNSLMVACKAGELECANVLMSAGANIDAANAEGWRSLMFAESRDDDEGRALVQDLKNAGATELSESEMALAVGFSEAELEQIMQLKAQNKAEV